MNKNHISVFFKDGSVLEYPENFVQLNTKYRHIEILDHNGIIMDIIPLSEIKDFTHKLDLALLN